MKWVRCVYNGDYSDITVGKIYEVLNVNTLDNDVVINIVNDLGRKDYWSMKGINNEIWFEDITAEIRDNKINQILNEVG